MSILTREITVKQSHKTAKSSRRREVLSQFEKPVIPRRRRRDLRPGEPEDYGRDPWFDMLTTLSEVEGESRKLA
jgi:hypothetical protein